MKDVDDIMGSLVDSTQPFLYHIRGWIDAGSKFLDYPDATKV
jgi:hypothetical protein